MKTFETLTCLRRKTILKIFIGQIETKNLYRNFLRGQTKPNQLFEENFFESYNDNNV